MFNAMHKKSAIAVALGALALSPIASADNTLTLSGFVDMSMAYTDPEGGDSSQSAGLDQVEFNFNYDSGDGLKATVDLEYQDNGSKVGGVEIGEEVDVEQAFLTYDLSDAVSIKAGRFLSYSGWETEEPAGLFQYSGTGYAKYFYGGYQQGVSFKYSAGNFGAALSLVNDLGDLEGEARDSEELGKELMLAFKPVDDWTVKAFYLTDKLAGTSEDTEMVNVWTSYAIDSLTLAAEFNTSESTAAAGAGAEAEGYLAMANYAWDKAGLTLRYHGVEVEDASKVKTKESTGITLAPSYQAHDNLLLVFEYRTDDNKLTKKSTDTVAVEALLTF